MGEKSKKEKLKEIIPILWNQYQHMHESRSNRTHNKINFLLIAVSFLPMISLTLYIIAKYNLFLIPIVFQLIAFLILLKSFFFKSSIPWTDTKEVIEHLESDDIYEFFFAQSKAGENQTLDDLETMKSIIEKSLYLILFSLYSLSVAFVFYISKGTILYLAILGLSTIFAIILFYYNKQSSRNSKEDFNEIFKEIKKWVSG